MTENNGTTTTRNFNVDLDFLKTSSGQLRTAQGILSVCALVSAVEGECMNDAGRFGFFLCIVVLTLLEAIFIIIVFMFHLHNRVPNVNLPLTFIMNDSITLLLHFINSALAMLSIGRCHYGLAARILATLFSLAIFLVYFGLCYTDYKWWLREKQLKETSRNGSTTVTETSSSVLA